LHLVEDQKRAGLVAQVAQALQAGVGQGRMPPSPWTGSMITAQVWSVMAAFSASWSPRADA
jgi:hypothetical protein